MAVPKMGSECRGFVAEALITDHTHYNRSEIWGTASNPP